MRTAPQIEGSLQASLRTQSPESSLTSKCSAEAAGHAAGWHVSCRRLRGTYCEQGLVQSTLRAVAEDGIDRSSREAARALRSWQSEHRWLSSHRRKTGASIGDGICPWSAP